MPEDIRDYVKVADDDDLASDLLARKAAIAQLREEIAHIEAELARRMADRNARILQGERFRVSSGIKRYLTWAQDKLADAAAVADAEGHGDMFGKAFKLEYKANLTQLNNLLKFGGRTAEAIAAAKVKEEERLEFKVTDAPT